MGGRGKEGKTAERARMGFWFGREEVPLVMEDKLVFEFFKSAGHSILWL